MSIPHRRETIVLASNNAGKVREINQLLAEARIRVVPRAISGSRRRRRPG
jgi:XTP/dITP diphosphohydrolase